METQLAQETIADHERYRTDDILFNVRYLREHYDLVSESFDEQAEQQVMQQNITEVGEAEIHALVARVEQPFDDGIGQYWSLGGGTIDNAIRGVEALNTDDPDTLFEFYRRVEEVTEEVHIHEPVVRTQLQAGAKKVLASPAPTHHEADLPVALAFGYDDRSMLRVQTISPDGRNKTMTSFVVFDVPAPAWAAFYRERNGLEVENTALAVMQASNASPLEQADSVEEVAKTYLEGVMPFLDDYQRRSVVDQLERFSTDQGTLQERARFYAKEKLEFEKELAASHNSHATPEVKRLLDSLYDQLATDHKQLVDAHRMGDSYQMTEDMQELALKLKINTTYLRAGITTANERTVRRVAAKIGLKQVAEIAEQEARIRQAIEDGIYHQLLQVQNEQRIASANVDCVGGCPAAVTNMFDPDNALARKAGLKGELYNWKDGECPSCKKKGFKVVKVLVNEEGDKYCTKCGDFDIKGVGHGNLKTGYHRGKK